MRVVTDDQGALPYRDIHTQNERGLDYGLRKRLGPLRIHVEHDVAALDGRQTYCREYNLHYLSLWACSLSLTDATCLQADHQACRDKEAVREADPGVRGTSGRLIIASLQMYPRIMM
jgi:hypothetical protein